MKKSKFSKNCQVKHSRAGLSVHIQYSRTYSVLTSALDDVMIFLSFDYFYFSTLTNLGKVSEPCCIKAPRENQNVFNRLKLLIGNPPLGSKSVHSYGLHLPTKNRTRLTATNATITHSQTELESGDMKENTPGFSLSGFLIMMLIPVFMKGLVKSTARCLSSLIVNGAMAISAF